MAAPLEPVAEPIKKQPTVPDQKKPAFDLPPVMQKRGGGYDFDPSILKEQEKLIEGMKQKNADD